MTLIVYEKRMTPSWRALNEIRVEGNLWWHGFERNRLESGQMSTSRDGELTQMSLPFFSIHHDPGRLSCNRSYRAGVTTVLQMNITVKVLNKDRLKDSWKQQPKLIHFVQCKSVGPSWANSNTFLASSVIPFGIAFPSGGKQTIYHAWSSDSSVF